MADEAILVADRIGQLLAELDPRATPTEKFRARQFELGLAWVSFPEGYGGLGFPPNLQREVDRRLGEAGAATPGAREFFGLTMAGPTVVTHGSDELRERLHDLGHRLEEQKISFDQLLAATARSGDDLVAELRIEALRAVKADLALRALADAEGIEVSDEELETALVAMAERLGVEPVALRKQVDRNGRTGAVRSEQRKAKALDWLLDNIELVDEAGNPISRDDLRVDQGERDQSGEREETVEAEETVAATTADEAER